MKILDIAFKDMLRSLRSAMGLVFMFVVPLLVTGMFYLMFGNIARRGEFELPRTQVIIANLDRDAPRLPAGSGSLPGNLQADTLSELVVEVLRSEELAALLEVTLATDASAARAAVDTQQAQVAVIIPPGFSRQFAEMDAQAEIEFYQDPTLTIAPGIVKSLLSQFMDGLSGVKIAADVAMESLDPQEYALIGQIIQQYLDSPVGQAEDLSAELLEVRSPAAASPQAEENPLLNIVGPIMGGMMIFYAFYTATATAESILREEEERTLPRLFTTPTPQASILSGKFLAVFLTVLMQVAVLLAASRLIFRIEWGSLPAVACMAVGLVISASAFGIFINSWLKNTKQGGIVFGGVLTLTGMVGMISIFAMSSPGAARLGNTVSLLVPQGWAVRGLLQAMNAEPFSNLALTTLVMLVWGLVFFAVGVWRFNRRYA